MWWKDYFDEVPEELIPYLGENPFDFVENLPKAVEELGGSEEKPDWAQQCTTMSGKNLIKTQDYREHCRIGGNLIAYEGAVLGRCGELAHSIFLKNARAPHFSFVAQSILGNDCNLGAGTITANVRLDGHDKQGAIIGDRVHTGINVSIMPGTMIGKDCMIYPHIRIKGIIPPGTTVKESNF